MQANNGRQRRPLGSNSCKAALLALWNLPDRFHWMSPLPSAHRKGVLLAALLMLVAFLWPAEDKSPSAPPSSAQEQTSAPLTPDVSSPPSTGTPAPQENVAPPPLVESGAPSPQAPSQPQEAIAAPAEPTIETAQAPAQPETPPTEEVWKEFTIQRGHTLAQVFRDNHLVVNDAYLLAQVEGPGKPVNALRIGQKVRIRVAEGNQVTGLEVELTPTQSALFTRQSNGRFLRVH